MLRGEPEKQRIYKEVTVKEANEDGKAATVRSEPEISEIRRFYTRRRESLRRE